MIAMHTTDVYNTELTVTIMISVLMIAAILLMDVNTPLTIVMTTMNVPLKNVKENVNMKL
jgi:hypothetical protein